MTIEHMTTRGPHGAGQLAADWMLESGIPMDKTWPRSTVRDVIRLAVPHQDMALNRESAAALRDALTAHLENLYPDPGPAPEALADLRAKLGGGVIVTSPWTTPDAPADVVAAAVEIRDAWADNSRTIGVVDARKFTAQEALEALRGLKADGLHYVGLDGVAYTPGAVDHLRSMEEPDLASPVRPGARDVRSKDVRTWTDTQARGAWNHAMEDVPSPGRLTDRPTSRAYSTYASQVLRTRLNSINGADAPRG